MCVFAVCVVCMVYVFVLMCVRDVCVWFGGGMCEWVGECVCVLVCVCVRCMWCRSVCGGECGGVGECVCPRKGAGELEGAATDRLPPELVSWR